MKRVVVEAVSKRFGGTLALRAASGEFDAGRVHLVVGANGSGKSTLLGVLGGTITPTSGNVSFEPAAADEAERRRRVGWLSHEGLVYGDLSGRRNLELAAEYYGLDAELVWPRVRDRFELGSFAERPFRTNSRGQRQRVAMARAFLHEPDLLLLDEPTTGLDAAGVSRLREVLSEELGRGAIAVVVAHDPASFSGLPCQRWSMARGRLDADSD